MVQNTGGISGSRASTEPSGLGPSGIDPGRNLNLVADKIDEAREMIERRGWVQCAFDSPDGVCVVGAFNRTPGIRHGDEFGGTAQKLFVEVTGGWSVMSWNDARGRTKEEVIAALRSAAALARSRSLPTVWAQINAYMADIESVSA